MFLSVVADQWHVNPEHRTSPEHRVDLHRVIEQVRQPLNDGQAQTEPLGTVPLDVVDLIEFLEDVVEPVLGNADTLIPHLNPQGLTAGPATDQDLSPHGIADRVG